MARRRGKKLLPGALGGNLSARGDLEVLAVDQSLGALAVASDNVRALATSTLAISRVTTAPWLTWNSP